MINRSLFVAIGLLGLATSSIAETINVPRQGLSISIPVITKDPQYLRGYRASYWYQPESLIWPHWRILFDFSAGHWWVTNTSRHHSLNIFAIAPVFRYYFTTNNYISPFFDISIGASYMTRTKLDDRNLGMHYSFQDQLGFGATFGKKQNFSVILSALHYSNGSLCRMNAGITVPLQISAEYGFD